MQLLKPLLGVRVERSDKEGLGGVSGERGKSPFFKNVFMGKNIQRWLGRGWQLPFNHSPIPSIAKVTPAPFVAMPISLLRQQCSISLTPPIALPQGGYRHSLASTASSPIQRWFGTQAPTPSKALGWNPVVQCSTPTPTEGGGALRGGRGASSCPKSSTSQDPTTASAATLSQMSPVPALPNQ